MRKRVCVGPQRGSSFTLEYIDTLLKLFFKHYLSRKYKFYCITYLTIEPVVVQNEKVVKQIYFYQIIVIFYKTMIRKKMYSDNHLQIYPSFSLRSLLNNSCIRYSSPLHVHEYFFVTAICDFKSYLSNHQHTLGKFSIEGGNAFFKTIEKCELCWFNTYNRTNKIIKIITFYQ